MRAATKNRVLTWLTGIVALLVALIAILYIAGQVVRNKLAGQYPAPGVMVAVNDQTLHVHCEGDGAVTILLEAGLNEFSVHWSRLQPLLARETKTCAYDRTGLGWSKPGEQIPTLDRSASNLHGILQAISDNKPVILVGHSYGAIIVRLYARRYPESIRAIVLLDPANEYLPERINGYAEVLDSGAEQFRELAPLASFGLMAFTVDSIPADLLPAMAAAQYRATLASGNFFEAAAAETGEMVNNLHAMQKYAQRESTDIPVVIISRGQAEPIPGLPEESARTLEQTWSQLQSDLVARLHARQLIADKSGHHIHLTQPELVFDTIRPFINDMNQ